MKVSVVIPTYNRKKELERTLKSIYTQKLLPDEIVIVDDASTIDIKKGIEKYLENGKVKITYLRLNENSGACFARNYGAKYSSGQILMFLDDDDTWESNKIISQLSVFKRNMEVDMVYTGKLVVNENDRQTITRKIKPNASGYLYPDILYKNLIGTTSCIAVKREAFFAVGGFDTNLPALQDIDFYIRLGKKGSLILHDGECNVRYTIAREPSKQISGSGLKQIKAVPIILKKYNTEIKAQGLIGSRKIKATFNFAIAKSVHKTNYRKSLHYSIKSIILFPNIRAFYLLFPSFIFKI